MPCFFAGTLLFSCQSSSEKVKNVKDNWQFKNSSSGLSATSSSGGQLASGITFNPKAVPLGLINLAFQAEEIGLLLCRPRPNSSPDGEAGS
ncbi:hypothetical protein [Prolixibacter bellariivorans]|uniref:hypothetical protein n=1 Tax=Prolixibacter bellariivorans TaxID=314319 RepID=UPI0005682979|nr:hypothetical protein [Prolixibacter bellariivorans]